MTFEELGLTDIEESKGNFVMGNFFEKPSPLSVLDLSFKVNTDKKSKQNDPGKGDFS